MILIIGGSNQGKLGWVKERYGFTDEEIAFGARLDVQPGKPLNLDGCKALYGLHKVMLQTIDWSVEDREALLNQLLNLPQDFVVICKEIGLGLVPVDQAGREYRETVGRACCDLAAASDEVWRVFCGLGQQIK